MIRSSQDSGEFEDEIDQISEDELDSRYLPARMINEFVYCPRLFYLMHVEGQFAHNAETVEGESVHQRVDSRTDPLVSPSSQTIQSPGPAPRSENAVLNAADTQPTKEEPIHARSVTLASDTLGVVAKLDLIEGTGTRVTPVDYKRGSPRVDGEGKLSAWDPERVQLCLQALILRENGFECDEGVLYFHSTRQRVYVKLDQQLMDQTEAAVKRARLVARQTVPPPPLVSSPKCPKCSLSPFVCRRNEPLPGGRWSGDKHCGSSAANDAARRPSPAISEHAGAIYRKNWRASCD